jgi:hypothetical protein
MIPALAGKVKSSFDALLQTDFVEFLARQTKFVQRESKLNGEKFTTMMVFAEGSLADTSLIELCEDYWYNNTEKITKQSLHERFNKYAVAFLKLLLKNVLARQINSHGFKELLPRQKAIKVKDSTSFQLPEELKNIFGGSGGKTSKACAKVQFEYDLKSGKVTDLSIGGFTTADLTDSYNTQNNIVAGDLLIRDLGYIDLGFLGIIQKKEAFFLNKIKSNVSLWRKNKKGLFEPLELAKIEKQMRKSKNATRQVTVYLGKEKNVQCRLIIECLPPEVSAQKLRRAKRAAQREGRTLGKDTKSRIGLNLFVTNMSDEDLPMENVWPLYRLRWQIELVFKVFKSVAQIDKIKKVNVFRFVCYLYGKLLWALLGWDVYWKLTCSAYASGKVISINKMMKSFRRLCWHIVNHNKKAMKEKARLLENFVINVFENCLLEKRKHKLSSVQIIEQLCKI